jgi:type IV pilus assembly protein PilO
MAGLKLNINMASLAVIDRLHPGAKAAIAFLPVLLILLPFYFLVYQPKSDQIKALTGEVKKLEGDIATAKIKAAKLPKVKALFDKVQAQYDDIMKQLPLENEVSSLLKQVADLGVDAGLEVSLWRPNTNKPHPSKIVFEIPVMIKMTGTYHRLGFFFSKLSGLERIINVKGIGLSNPKAGGESMRTSNLPEASLTITLDAYTYTAVPEQAENADDKKSKKKGKK